jgi:hypothetical protein
MNDLIKKEFENNLEILEIHARTHKPVKHITNGAKYETQLLYEILTEARNILNKIKNRTIIELPYKIGTKIYAIVSLTSDDRNFCIIEDIITHYSVGEVCTVMGLENHIGVPEWDWDKIFLTREEAKQALKGGADNESERLPETVTKTR